MRCIVEAGGIGGGPRKLEMFVVECDDLVHRVEKNNADTKQSFRL